MSKQTDLRNVKILDLGNVTWEVVTENLAEGWSMPTDKQLAGILFLQGFDPLEPVSYFVWMGEKELFDIENMDVVSSDTPLISEYRAILVQGV